MRAFKYTQSVIHEFFFFNLIQSQSGPFFVVRSVTDLIRAWLPIFSSVDSLACIASSIHSNCDPTLARITQPCEQPP